MKRVIDTSEILGTVELPTGRHEVCASAVAGYDEGRGHLVVNLSSFLRMEDLREKERQISADWLPKPETVTESVGPEEAGEVARDIFHRWAKKVRQSAPALHGPVI